MASFNGYVELPDGRYGEFHKWWYPQMDGFTRENVFLKNMDENWEYPYF